MPIAKIKPVLMQNVSAAAAIHRREPNIAFVLALVAAGLFYNLVLLPNAPSGYPSLKMNPEIFASVQKALAEGWHRLLLPFEYEVGRFYWCPSVIFLVYFIEKYLGGTANFIIFYSAFIGTVFYSCYRLTESSYFARIVAFLFAFGTQLDYIFTFGNLIALYLVLTYVAISFAALVEFIKGQEDDWRAFGVYCVATAVAAVSNEMWINYATGLICALAFGILWARHQDLDALSRRCMIALAALVTILAAYLVIRMRVASQYVQPGAEEELIVTYKHFSLFFDDVIVNFFTLLFMSLSNYLPSFVSGSNSLTFLKPDDIIDSQHGYHAEYINLIVMNHLFLWRFHAGVLVTLFLGAMVWMLIRSWQTRDIVAAIIVALALMVVGGFSTHLSIKMRPYNSTPHLPYKVIMSVSAWTVLIGYVAWQVAEMRGERARRWIAIGLGVVVLSAALTRPGMHATSLAKTGLAGFADPLPKLQRLWYSPAR